MDSARPVFVALADAEALAGAEDAEELAGAELLFAADAGTAGRRRGAYAHRAADERTNCTCSYQGDGALGALCRVSIDRAVGSAAGGIFVYLIKFVAGVAHLSSFHGSLFTGWYRTALPRAQSQLQKVRSWCSST